MSTKSRAELVLTGAVEEEKAQSAPLWNVIGFGACQKYQVVADYLPFSYPAECIS